MILEFARAHFWPLFWTGCGILAAVVAFTVWYVLTEPAHDAEPWEDGWQVEPVTDLDAATMAAEWRGTDLPGPAWATRMSPDQAALGGSRAGELHHTLERTVTRDVWDEWWRGLDGLDRECFLVRHAREREERLWAELVAETREMCAA